MHFWLHPSSGISLKRRRMSKLMRATSTHPSSETSASKHTSKASTSKPTSSPNVWSSRSSISTGTTSTLRTSLSHGPTFTNYCWPVCYWRQNFTTKCTTIIKRFRLEVEWITWSWSSWKLKCSRLWNLTCSLTIRSFFSFWSHWSMPTCPQIKIRKATQCRMRITEGYQCEKHSHGLRRNSIFDVYNIFLSIILIDKV